MHFRQYCHGPYFSWLGRVKSPAGNTVTLRCFLKYSTGPDKAIDISNGPVGQVALKKLDFRKNVKIHILKKAYYIEVLKLFYL